MLAMVESVATLRSLYDVYYYNLRYIVNSAIAENDFALVIGDSSVNDRVHL